MKIGISGGSFNPIHCGHLVMAQSALEGCALDRVIFMPAFCSPHKSDAYTIEAKHRLAMVKAAVKGHPRFSVSDCEIKRGGISYTIDTLHYLRRIYPKAKFFWIVGADTLKKLHTWKGLPDILKLTDFIAVNRPGHLVRSKVNVLKAEMPALDISSSDLRRRVEEKKSIQYLTPEPVIRYIDQHKLYS